MKYDGVIAVIRDGEKVVVATRLPVEASIASLDRLNALLEKSDLADNISRRVKGRTGMELRLELNDGCVTPEQGVRQLKSMLIRSEVMTHPYIVPLNRKVLGARSL